MKRMRQEQADFGKKVKKEKLTEDEESENFLNVPIPLTRCFVNLHNGTDLNNIAKCTKCSRKSSENLASIKKENLHEDPSLSFLLKVNDIKSFREKFQPSKNEFFKEEVAPVKSRRYCIDIIELSSDSEVDYNANNIPSTNAVNTTIPPQEEKVEKFDNKIVKTEIKEEKVENFNNNHNLLNECKKEKLDLPDNSIFEPSIKEESIEDFNEHSPTYKSLFTTGEKLNNDNGIIASFKKDPLVEDFTFFDKENPVLKPKIEEEIKEEFVSTEKSESMKKLEILRRYCETFECEHCGKQFSKKVVCKAHVEVIHEGGKPYKCKECDKTFKYAFSRRQHYFKDHKNIKAYKCVTCGKQFLTYGWYQRHRCSVRKFKN